jgi:hypothetical protein
VDEITSDKAGTPCQKNSHVFLLPIYKNKSLVHEYSVIPEAMFNKLPQGTGGFYCLNGGLSKCSMQSVLKTRSTALDAVDALVFQKKFIKI